MSLEDKTELPTEKPAPKPIQLIITLVPEIGGVNVQGPIQDRFLCFGMLEMAKDAIRTHQENQNKQQLIKSNGQHRIMDFLRGGR